MNSEAEIRLENAGRALAKAGKDLVEATAAVAAAEVSLDEGTGKPDQVVRAKVVLESAERRVLKREIELTEAQADVAKERRSVDATKLAELRPQVANWRAALAPHISTVLSMVAALDRELAQFGATVADEEERYQVALDLAGSLRESTLDLKANAPSLPEARLQLQRELTADRERTARPDLTHHLASVDIHNPRTKGATAAEIAANEATAKRLRHQEVLEEAGQAGFAVGALAAKARLAAKNAPPPPDPQIEQARIEQLNNAVDAVLKEVGI